MTLTASVDTGLERSRTWLDGVASVPDPSGAQLTLRRSWPRSADHALLEYTGAPTPEGVVVGQWFADAQRARHVAGATVAATESGGVVLHQRGADRRLAALPQLLGDPSARLVVHRPERRAVVRLDPRPGVRGRRQWVKVVRTEQLERLVARAAGLDGSGLVAPQLLEVHADDGVTVWSDVAGTPLSDLLDTPSVHEVMGHVAVVVHRLHTSATPPPDAEPHTAGHEIGVLQRWLGLLEHYDPEAHRRAAPLLGPVSALLDRDADTTGRLGGVHRDLHDGQLLVDGPRIGLLDPDTLAFGEPELDLANLAAHLRLAACAGRCHDAVPGAAVDVLLDAYGRDRVRPARLRAYLAASLLRLVAVHAFRPATRGAALALAASVEDILRHED